MRLRFVFLSLVVLLGAFPSPYPCFAEEGSAAADAPASDQLYLEAERLFIKNDFQAALEKLNQFFASSASKASPKTASRSHNLKGLIYFQLKNINAATEEFEQAVSIALDNFPPTDPSLHLARYNLANALHQSNRSEEASSVLQQINPAALDNDTRVRFYHLQGNVYASADQNRAALESFLRAGSITHDPLLQQAYIQRAFTASQKVFLQDAQADLSELQGFAPELSGNTLTELALQLILARGQMYLGNHEEAAHLVDDFLARAPQDHPLHKQALDIQQQIQRLSAVEPDTIGILLPLSGKFAKFGRLCLNASSLALGAFEDMPMGPGEGKFHFVIKDSGDTPETALAAFDRLVFEDHAIAVIGPLLSKQGTPVAQKAQEYGVPLFSLSQRNEPGKLGSFVFPVALSPSQQIDIIVKAAMERRGYKRFGIMAPSDSFGDDYVKLFWDAIEARKGKVMALERYTPKSTDFRDELRSMLGLEFPEARTLESEELQRRSEIFASKLKVKGLTRKRMLQAFDLQPIVEFDAVFIPDDPQVVGQIAPAFAVMGVEKIPFLGINTWNNPEIVQRAGRYVQNSLFVDAFFSQSTDPKAQQFLAEFKNHFTATPGTLEVQAYDAARILLQNLSAADLKTRAQLQQSIVTMGKFSGASGEFEFNPKGISRSAYLLSVQGNNIVEVAP